MKKSLLSFLAILCYVLFPSTHIWTQDLEQDTLINVFREEAAYYLEHLSQQEIPAYFISFRVSDDVSLKISSDFGAASTNRNHQRLLMTQVRVGSQEQDNYIENSQNNSGNSVGFKVENTTPLPFDNTSLPAIRDAVWQNVYLRYEAALAYYRNTMRQRALVKNSPDSIHSFSANPTEKYYEPPLSPSAYRVDESKWAQWLNEASSVFKANEYLTEGNASLEILYSRNYVVNTEQTAVVQNRMHFRVSFRATVQTPDGMEYPLEESYFAFSEKKLPTKDVLIQTANQLAERLENLRNAPVADVYAGPAIMSGDVSGIFFHELLGHTLEGGRTHRGRDGLEVQLGRSILFDDFRLSFDPTMEYYDGIALSGHYLFDDEGCRGERVTCVDNGVHSNYLMSRKPMKAFNQSNGHGRAALGYDAVARQSNLFVETTHPYTEEQLRQMLREELLRQGKEFGYYFHTASSGWTRMGDKERINSFKVVPREVFRVYADGRPDQLVRGLAIIGTPLAMLTSVKAAGGKASVINRYCGSESGWIPMATVAPMVFLSQIETQGIESELSVRKEIMPRPTTKGEADNQDASQIIFTAMNDEMDRAKSEMKTDETPPAFFIDYILKRESIVKVESSLGSLHEKTANGVKNSISAVVYVGDSMTASTGSTSRNDIVVLPDELNYDNIRLALWRKGTDAYKSAVVVHRNTLEALKLHPIPEREAAVPFWNVMPPVRWQGESALSAPCNPEELRRLTDELSVIFREYPELSGSAVGVKQTLTDSYRLTSEGQQLLLPEKYLQVYARADVATLAGKKQTRHWCYTVTDWKDLPSQEILASEIRTFAQTMVEQGRAKGIEDDYTGPVMFEGQVASEMVTDYLWTYFHTNRNFAYNTYGSSYKKLGTTVIDKKISVCQLAGTSSYEGKKLVGYVERDADGVEPLSLSLVEKGVLKNQLAGRKPSLGQRHSTGNERMPYLQCERGILRMTSTKTMSPVTMRKKLLREAKKAGLKYAYIIKSSYTDAEMILRVDVQTGKEELVSAYVWPRPTQEEMTDILCVSNKETAYPILTTFSNSTERSFIMPEAIVLRKMHLELIPLTREPDANMVLFKLKH